MTILLQKDILEENIRLHLEESKLKCNSTQDDTTTETSEEDTKSTSQVLNYEEYDPDQYKLSKQELWNITDEGREYHSAELEEHNEVRDFPELRETSYKFDKKYKHLIKYLGIKNIYDVPVRKDMFTATGKELRCHWNVALLAKKYGGHVVSGYHLFIGKKKGTVKFNAIAHSCWLTPENKLVDVTYGVQDEWMKRHKLDETICRFAPLVKFDPTKETIVSGWDFAANRNYMKTGVGVMSTWSNMFIESINNGETDLKDGIRVEIEKNNTFVNTYFFKQVQKEKPWITGLFYKTKFEQNLYGATLENHFDFSQRKVA